REIVEQDRRVRMDRYTVRQYRGRSVNVSTQSRREGRVMEPGRRRRPRSEERPGGSKRGAGRGEVARQEVQHAERCGNSRVVGTAVRNRFVERGACFVVALLLLERIGQVVQDRGMRRSFPATVRARRGKFRTPALSARREAHVKT